MTKPCHLVVRLGKNALLHNSRYNVYLKIPLNHVYNHMLETADDYCEMTYKNEGPSDIQWGDVQGCACLMMSDGTESEACGFGCCNFWIGYPQAVIGYTSDFNPYVDGYDYHKFSENETYSWKLEYSDDINTEKWYITYRMERLSDTSSKEFILWLDD